MKFAGHTSDVVVSISSVPVVSLQTWVRKVRGRGGEDRVN